MPSSRHFSTFQTAASISISRVKAKLRTEHDPEKALEIYSSVSNHYSSPAISRYAQDLTVRRLANSGRFSDIESLIESHKKDPNIVQEPYLSSLIRSYGRAGMFDHAMKTFDQMEKLGTPRSALSFNALLLSCIQAKQFDRVPQLFAEIPKKYNVSPDKISYGMLVKSYCEAGSPEQAMNTLKEMESEKVEVTAVTFTTIIDSLYKQGKNENAEKLWKEMVNNGCELDVAAFNVMIMNEQSGDPEKVMEWIEEMIYAGLKPDTISYNYLMSSYCKMGMIEEAMKVYEGLKKKGCKPNSATFRILIFHFCKNGDNDKGFRLFKESVKVHKVSDFNTLKNLVEGLVKDKKKKEAKEMFRTVKKKLPPNMLDEWKKVEKDVGFVSVDADAESKDEKIIV